MRVTDLALIAFVTACATREPSIYELQAQRAKLDSQALLRTETCAPGQDHTTCGLIVPDLQSPSAKAKFQAEICPANFDDACTQRWVKMVFARWSDRYPKAQWANVVHWSEANPVEAKDLVSYERQILTSHNDTVNAEFTDTVNGLRRTQAQDVRQNNASFLQGLANGLKAYSNSLNNNRSVSCSSDSIGSTVYTNCN